MMKHLPLLSALLLLSCTRPSAPAPEEPTPAPQEIVAGKPRPEDVGADSAAAPPSEGPRCSASPLRSEPRAPRTPLPPAVESMRRRIVAAAVACDYEALAKLSREKGTDFSFGFGPEKDLAATWRQREKEGEPVLERLVRVLNLPYTQLDTLYVWPSVYGPEASPEDWKALEDVYSPAEVAELRSNEEGYLGFRTGIDESGAWQFALSGD